MTIEKKVDFVMTALSFFAIVAILYGIVCLVPDAFDAMYESWGMTKP